MRNFGARRNRIIRRKLDDLGIITDIRRVHSKRFELIVNFKIEKVYKNRESANVYLRKLLDTKTKIK